MCENAVMFITGRMLEQSKQSKCDGDKH